MAERFSLGGALKAAFGFWGRGVRATAGILALAAIAGAWWLFVLVQLMNAAAAAAKGAEASATDAPLASVAFSAFTLVSALAEAALYRAAFNSRRKGEPPYPLGPLGFQVDAVEAGVVVAVFLRLVLTFALGFLLNLGAGAILVAVAMARGIKADTPEQLAAAFGPSWPPSPQWTPILLYWAFALLLQVWVAMRLSLAPAASAAERRVRVLSAWPLTKGRFWAILLVQAVIFLSGLALAVGVSLAAEQIIGLAHLKLASADIQAIVLLIIGALMAYVTLPLLAGFNAYLYDCVGPTPSPEGKSP